MATIYIESDRELD